MISNTVDRLYLTTTAEIKEQFRQLMLITTTDDDEHTDDISAYLSLEVY